MEVLNSLRKARGLNTIALRPHAGETGNPMHLASTYMLCESINHGINLDMQVSLQYLYYLDQIGLSISPLSNNFLFRKIAENPFQKFFRRGLNVTLSTDDPLLFHMSDDALLEEYSVARASFDLSMTDLMVSNFMFCVGALHLEHKGQASKLLLFFRKSHEILSFSQDLKNPSRKSTLARTIAEVSLTATNGLRTCPSFEPSSGLNTSPLSICFVS